MTKYLSHYLLETQPEIDEKYGAFIALTPKQFNAQRVPGVSYSGRESGYFVPDEHYVAWYKEGTANLHKCIAHDITDHTLVGCIKRELENKCYSLTRNMDEVLRALSGYGVSEDMVKEVLRGL